MAAEGRTLRRDFERAVESGLLDLAQEILAGAQDDVPVGDPTVDPDPSVSLRELGHIEIERGGKTILIVFDGPYAAKVHEAEQYEHPRGGAAKFLERNALARVPRAEGIVGSKVRARFAGR